MKERMYYYTVVTPHTLQAAPCCVRMVAHQIWIVQCATAQWVSLGKHALQTLMSVTILTVVWVAQHVEMNLVATGVNVHQALLGRIVERISMSASITHAWTMEYAQMTLAVSVAIAQMATSGKRVGMWNHVFGTALKLACQVWLLILYIFGRYVYWRLGCGQQHWCIFTTHISTMAERCMHLLQWAEGVEVHSNSVWVAGARGWAKWPGDSRAAVVWSTRLLECTEGPVDSTSSEQGDYQPTTFSTSRRGYVFMST